MTVTAMIEQRRVSVPPVWRRALLAWVLMAVASTLNGIFRVVVLEPRWDAAWAGAASAATGITWTQLIARRLLRDQRLSARQRVEIAAAWLLLTVTFELTFGRVAGRKSWKELLANYNVARGHLWPLVLASVVAAPFVWRRSLTER